MSSAPGAPEVAAGRHELGHRLGAWMKAVVTPLVQHPDRLSVEPAWIGTTLMLQLRTPVSADVGRLAGKSGQTITALRRLAAVAGAREGIAALVEIVPDSHRRPARGAPA